MRCSPMASALDHTLPGTEVLPRISARSLGPSITAVFSWAGRGVHQLPMWGSLSLICLCQETLFLPPDL